jgi:hypothetical protein
MRLTLLHQRHHYRQKLNPQPAVNHSEARIAVQLSQVSTMMTKACCHLNPDFHFGTDFLKMSRKQLLRWTVANKIIVKSATKSKLRTALQVASAEKKKPLQTPPPLKQNKDKQVQRPKRATPSTASLSELMPKETVPTEDATTTQDTTALYVNMIDSLTLKVTIVVKQGQDDVRTFNCIFNCHKGAETQHHAEDCDRLKIFQSEHLPSLR